MRGTFPRTLRDRKLSINAPSAIVPGDTQAVQAVRLRLILTDNARKQAAELLQCVTICKMADPVRVKKEGGIVRARTTVMPEQNLHPLENAKDRWRVVQIAHDNPILIAMRLSSLEPRVLLDRLQAGVQAAPVVNRLELDVPDLSVFSGVETAIGRGRCERGGARGLGARKGEEKK
jgi:hypothetical protein